MAVSKKKKKVGRPDKYKPEFCEALIDFFKIDLYSVVQLKESREYDVNGTLRKESYEKKPMANRLPTMTAFAEKIGVERHVFKSWVAKYEKFATAFTRAHDLQKDFIINLGLSGVSPPAFAIFVATNLTDMKPASTADYGEGQVIIPVVIQRGNPNQLNTPRPPKRLKGMDVHVLTNEETEKIRN